MVQSQAHERKGRPPNAHDFADELTAAHAEITGQADQPIGADGTQEDLMPVWGELFGGCEGDDLRLERAAVKGTAVTQDDGHDEQGAREVAEEGDDPVKQGFGDA